MSSDDPATSEDIDLTSQPAVVQWQGANAQPLVLSDLHFDIHYNVASDKAFFKIWAKVALKASRNQLKRVFFLIQPERIESLTCQDNLDVKYGLGPTTLCLRFVLNNAATLVGPKVDLAPRNKSSGDKLDALRLLSSQLSFNVYVNPPTRVLPRTQISSLCTLVSQHRLRSIMDHANVGRLYAGQGGYVIEASAQIQESTRVSPDVVDEDATTASMPSSPPSYDDLPPPPPAVEPQAGPSKKRRREESAEDQAIESGAMTMSRKMMEEICAQMIDSRLAGLKCDMARQLEDLEGRLMDHIQDRIDEVREDARQETGATIDDEFYGVKAELQDYVDDEFKQMEERFVERINSAKVSLEIEL